MSSVYTRTGDNGNTSIGIGITRYRKSHPIIKCLGQFDCVIAHLGKIFALWTNVMNNEFKTVQDKRLYDLVFELILECQTTIYKLCGLIHKNCDKHIDDYDSSSNNICNNNNTNNNNNVNVSLLQDHQDDICRNKHCEVYKSVLDLVKGLECWIDSSTLFVLPSLIKFIRPGNFVWSADVHICRTEVRRAEQMYITMIDMHGTKELNSILDLLTGPFMQFVNRLSDFLFMLARYDSKLKNESVFQ